MLYYLLRRLVGAVAVLFGVVTGTFVLCGAQPRISARTWSPQATRASEKRAATCAARADRDVAADVND